MKKMSGGLAGDLMRLYPIQSESMFPHKVTYICLCIEYSLEMVLCQGVLR